MPTMRALFRLKHEPDYYRGLGLLLTSCLTLVWALWRDAFTPEVFLAGFLCFSWGYAFLWRHDLNQRLTSLSAELAEIKARLGAMEGEEREERAGAEAVAWAQEIPEKPEAGAMEPAPEAAEATAAGEEQST